LNWRLCFGEKNEASNGKALTEGNARILSI